MNIQNQVNKPEEQNLQNTKGVLYEAPECDINETKDGFEIFFDMPGADKEKINIKVEKDILFVTADTTIKPDTNYNCIREEMTYNGYRRGFNLNKTVNSENITAEYSDGALKVVLPKIEEQKTKEIKVKIS